MPPPALSNPMETRWRRLFGPPPPNAGLVGLAAGLAESPAERILQALAKDARKTLGPTLTSQAMMRLVGSMDVELAIAGAGVDGAPLVMVGSASRDEGCTVTALGIALCAAAMDPARRVLLIDANDGSATRALGETNTESRALASPPKGDGSALAYVVSPTTIANLQLLARGHEGGDRYRLRGALDQLLDEARACFDLVVIDAPALPDDPAALALAHKAGYVLLVVRRAGLPASAVAGTIEDLRRVGSTLLGCVLTDQRRRRGRSAKA